MHVLILVMHLLNYVFGCPDNALIGGGVGSGLGWATQPEKTLVLRPILRRKVKGERVSRDIDE